MNHDKYDDSYIRSILNGVKTIAIVGASANESRPSLFVTKYLAERGYRVFPINPGHETVGGIKAYAKLADVPEKIDMVDVFRAPSQLSAVVDEVLALHPRPAVIWGEYGVRDDAAAEKAEAAGLRVVMDRCPVTEFPRLTHHRAS